MAITVNCGVSGIRPIKRVIADGYGTTPFVFYVSDCFDPPMYLVLSDSMDNAWDCFINDEKVAEQLKLDDMALADYREASEVIYNDHGVPIDYESVKGFEVSWDSLCASDDTPIISGME